jgi:hypothetical protein
MMEVTVEKMADICDVTEKTVRQWIRDEGLPVTRAGGKGAGNAARVDVARFAHWHRKHRNERRTHWSAAFAKFYPGRNPLRDIVLAVGRDQLSLFGSMLANWADRPADTGKCDWREDGLSQAQARAVAAKVWALVALAVTRYHDDRLDDRLIESTGCDLDAWLSFLMEGDFQTEARVMDVELPPAIAALMPAGFTDALARRPSARVRKGNGRT